MSLCLSALLGDKLQLRTGEESTAQVLGEKKTILLFFGARWCPNSRRFSPQLARWYEHDLKRIGLGVVYISADKSEEQFNEYFRTFPSTWAALPYADRERWESLMLQFGGKEEESKTQLWPDQSWMPLAYAHNESMTLPTIVVLNSDAKVVREPESPKFPFHPNVLSDMMRCTNIKESLEEIDALARIQEDLNRKADFYIERSFYNFTAMVRKTKHFKYALRFLKDELEDDFNKLVAHLHDQASRSDKVFDREDLGQYIVKRLGWKVEELRISNEEEAILSDVILMWCRKFDHGKRYEQLRPMTAP